MAQQDGKITYRKLTIPQQQADNISLMLGFNDADESLNWYVYYRPHSSSLSDSIFQNKNFQVYCPTFSEERTLNGKTIRVDRPKFLNYIFVLSTYESILAHRDIYEITPVYNHVPEGDIIDEKERFMSIPRKQMHSLMLVEQGYDKEIEFCTPSEHILSKGDKVRIVDGPFKDTEGLLVSNQGNRTGGYVIVPINKRFGVTTKKIPESHIKVLQFSPNTNHFFRKISSMERFFNKCFEQLSNATPLSPEQRAAIKYFLFRYSEVTGLSHVNMAKLTASRYVCHMLLHHQESAKQCLSDYKEHITNDKNAKRAVKRWPTAQEYLTNWVNRVDNIMAKVYATGYKDPLTLA